MVDKIDLEDEEKKLQNATIAEEKKISKIKASNLKKQRKAEKEEIDLMDKRTNAYKMEKIEFDQKERARKKVTKDERLKLLEENRNLSQIINLLAKKNESQIFGELKSKESILT
ncbi:MAG: hypothetical protein H8E13_21575, partial [Actinobacteria bacterium]|nr:hypothetical protein [Actinomycetota bacterium]